VPDLVIWRRVRRAHRMITLKKSVEPTANDQCTESTSLSRIFWTHRMGDTLSLKIIDIILYIQHLYRSRYDSTNLFRITGDGKPMVHTAHTTKKYLTGVVSVSCSNKFWEAWFGIIFLRPSFAWMRKRSLHGWIHGVSKKGMAKVCRFANCGTVVGHCPPDYVIPTTDTRTRTHPPW
jgi:hypothetical protein